MKGSTSALLIAALAATSIAAAEDVSTASGQPEEQLEEVLVTGTNFKVARNNRETPVTVIDSQQLNDLGINSNMLEVLRKGVPAIAGRSNTGNSNANNVNQNTAGGSRVQIRNLDTLVLINGRRAASNGIGAVGGKDFVDINRIPTAAIERLEVLTDGASAIYGADAVGGVVNIILKSDFKGIEAGTRAAQAAGGYNEKSAYIRGGAGTAEAHIVATASWSKTDPLYQNQRPFARTYRGRLTSFPGVAGGALLNPTLLSPSQTNPTGARATATSLAALIANGTYLAGTNPSIAPGISSQFDAAPYQTMLLDQDQRAFVTSGSAEILGKKLEVFADYMYSQTASFNQTFQAKNNLSTVTVPAGAPYNPLTVAFTGVVFGDLANPLQTYNDSKANRIVAGLRGVIGESWNWETAYTYDQSKLEQRLKNTVYIPNLARAIAGGYDASGNVVAGGTYSRVITGFSEAGSFVFQPALDPFARGGISAASTANLLGTETISATSRLMSFDAKLVGSLFKLPAGDFGVAVGGSWRKESLSGGTDPNGTLTLAGGRRWGGGSYFDPFSASRTVSAGFVELRAPVFGESFSFPGVRSLVLTAAGRREHYSDTGTSTVPKVGFLWRPIDQQLSVRGAYSKAYNAPALYNLYSPPSVTISGPAVLATQLNNPAFQGQTYNQLNTSNPDLKPSTAQSRSFGLVLAPKLVRGLTLSADYVNVVQTGFQGGAPNTLQSVDRLGPASPYINTVAFNNFVGLPGAVAITAPGQLSAYLSGGGSGRNIYSTGFFINLAKFSVEAVDYTLDYQTTMDSWGKISFSTNVSQLLHYKVQATADQPAYENAGYATNPGYGTLPKWQSYSTLNWDYKAWGVVIANTIIPSVGDIRSGNAAFYTSSTSVEVHVPAYTTWDLQGSYTFNFGQDGHNLRFALGCNNLFNRMPPLAPQAFVDNNVDVSTYSPIGRLFFASLTAKF